MSPDIPQGYLPPDEAYTQAREFTLQNDPLVNDSRNGISGWFNKIIELFARSGKTLLALFAVTVFVPGVLAGILSGSGGGLLGNLDLDGDLVSAAPPPELFAGAAVIAVFAGIIAGFVQMIGFAGATYAATRQAAGMTVRWTEGMRYGLRRFMGLFGWYVTASLSIGIPLLLISACLLGVFSFVGIVPLIVLAVYAFMAVALVGPAYLFERRNALRRSFGLFHGAPRRMAGRLILAGLVYAAIIAADQLLALVPASLPGSGPQLAAEFAVAVIGAGVQTLGLMVIFAAILVTYAERLGDEGSLTPDLVNQL